MSISTEIQYTSIDELFLDPMNPRLGFSWIAADHNQEELLDKLIDYSLEEIAQSYIENGYWIQEALIVIEDEYMGEKCKLVVEGNRRLAALKYLEKTMNGQFKRKKWQKMIEDQNINKELFTQIPYLMAGDRKDVASFLGFRHVTGIKQWDAEEKAGFITQLRDKEGLPFNIIAKKIGSKTPSVKRHYFAYKVLNKIRDEIEVLDENKISGRFTVLYMTLDTTGAKKYLNYDEADMDNIDEVLAKIDKDALLNLSIWLFGTKEKGPLLRDTRNVNMFSKILENQNAINYLKRNEFPDFNIAFRTAGGDKDQIINSIYKAADNIQLALTKIHVYESDDDVIKSVKDLKIDCDQLFKIFKDNL